MPVVRRQVCLVGPGVHVEHRDRRHARAQPVAVDRGPVGPHRAQAGGGGGGGVDRRTCHGYRPSSCAGTAGCPRLCGDEVRSTTGRRGRSATESQGAAMTPANDVRIVDRRGPEERDRPFLPGTGQDVAPPALRRRQPGGRCPCPAAAGGRPRRGRRGRRGGRRRLRHRQPVPRPARRPARRPGHGAGPRRGRVAPGRAQGAPPPRAAHPGAGVRRPAPRRRRIAGPRGLVAGPAPRRRRRPDRLRARRPPGAPSRRSGHGRRLRRTRAGRGATPQHGSGQHGSGHSPAHALRHLPRLLRSRVEASPAVARNQEGGLLALFTGAGFEDVREVDHVDHRFGRVSFVQATRPGPPRGAGPAASGRPRP